MKLTLAPFRYPTELSTLTALRSVPTAKPEQPEQQAAVTPPPVVAPGRGVLFDIEYGSRFNQQHRLAEEQTSAHAQRAISAYSSVTALEERTRLSDLFGLNEYA